MLNPTERMIPASEVMETVGVRSDTTLRELIKRDGFPHPYEITRGKRHWAMSEVQNWLHKRMAAQRGVAA